MLFAPKDIRSLAIKTDLLFHQFGGIVEARDGYLVIRTPRNPAFHYGNSLVFPRAPGPGDGRKWLALFRDEFAGSAGILHVCIAWDGTDGEPGAAHELEEAGMTLDPGVVLTATNVELPRRAHTQAEVRKLETQDDWEAALAVQIACRDAKYGLDTYTPYKRAELVNYRAMAKAGLGDWYGAFVGGRMAGCLGLYFDAAIGRFQTVATVPEMRRQGVCGRLVFEVARAALAQGRAERLVMVADPAYFAARIYETVGFRITERTNGAIMLEG